jgi:pimeloyl-ACP methyl ester carboxylesterase
MDGRMTKTRLAGFAALTLLGLAAFALAAGGAYNALSVRHYRAQVGAPGRLYRVDGSVMHIYCTGKGAPAIVLSAGLGDDSLIWAKVQPELSKTTTVCSYDRAGFGWSDPRPGRQDANAIARQLHDLIAAAGIRRPVILMGHSISGLYLRAYAARYPGDLAGLVFVDGATPLQDDRIPRALVKIQDDQRRAMPWTKLRMMLGWYRLTGDCTAITPGFERYAAWIKADSCIPSQVDAIENELDAERVSGEQTLHAAAPRDLPVLILSRDPKVLPSNWPAAVAKANSIVWNTMQEEAKVLSDHSRRIIAKGSDHYIQIDRADLVNREVSAFTIQVRRHDFSRLDGSTTEE